MFIFLYSTAVIANRRSPSRRTPEQVCTPAVKQSRSRIGIASGKNKIALQRYPTIKFTADIFYSLSDRHNKRDRLGSCMTQTHRPS